MPISNFDDFLSTNQSSYRFLFVNDGSRDNTADVLQELCDKFSEHCTFLNLKKNVGKAEAIRQGTLYLLQQNEECDYVGFMDADLSTPLSEIKEMEFAAERFSKPSMLIGSRIKLFGSTTIIRSNRRHYIGRIIATLISKSLKLPIYDTQCGFKFIRYDRLNDLFKEEFISRWLFDVELIFRLLSLTGYDGIEGELFELPVTRWEEKGDSKIPLSYAFKMPLELLRIRFKYN